MQTPSRCVCRHPDARECYAIRYGLDTRRGADRHEEHCDCSCHSRDEDGFTDWDDENDRRNPSEDWG